MPNALQMAGALSEPSNFAPLHTNRLITGLWTNRNILRDAATNEYQERFGLGRFDSIMGGYNAEISSRLTLRRRPGSTIYNPNTIAPVKRFYGFNTFTLTDELIRVMADTATQVLDITGGGNTAIWNKSAGAGSTYFLGVGNTLYFTNGVENKQWNYESGSVWNWGIQPPANAPTVTQKPRPNNYPAWQPGTGYEVNSPAISGMLILDDLTNVPSNVKLIPVSSSPPPVSFSYCRIISIPAQTALSGDLANYPVLVAGTYSYLATTANGGLVQNASGYDIRFFTDTTLSSRLDWEVESYDPTSGAVIFWVKVPVVAQSAATTFVMAYGNPSISADGSNATGTWDADFTTVYHFGDGTTLDLNDSTANALNGTNTGATPVAGQIGGAADITPGQIFVPNPDMGTVHTASLWINPQQEVGSANYGPILGTPSTSSFETSPLGVYHVADDDVIYRIASGQVEAPVPSMTGTWHHIASVRNGLNITIYYDGTAQGSGSLPANEAWVFGQIGNTGGTSYHYLGLVDEVRVSSTPRSADWIATDFASQGNPAAFYSVGPQATPQAILPTKPASGEPRSSGDVAVMCGQNYASGSQIALPAGFDTAHMMVWTTACSGYSGSALAAGVYNSYGTGGVVSSAFQSPGGGYGFDSSTNWIAIAWTPGASVTPYTTGNYSGIIFRTLAGDLLCFQIGTGYNGTNINVPSGFSIANSLSMCGMVSTENVNHVMQGVYLCNLSGTTIQNLYDDGSGNVWRGNTAVFTAFWQDGVLANAVPVTNGTALIVPTTGTDTCALIFAVVPFNQQYGLPPNYTLSQVVGTCAMAAHGPTAGNRSHGWLCELNGQTYIGYVMDSQGHSWTTTANVFAVGAITTASGGNVQYASGSGTTGATEPTWNQVQGGTTPDNTITWTNLGPAAWQAGHTYNLGDVCMGVVINPPSTPNQLYVASTPGISGFNEPRWQAGTGLQQSDNSVVWTCLGRALVWSDLGPNTPITAVSSIVDTKGYLQTISSPGVSGPTEPTFATELGALTQDGTAVWQNMGAFSIAQTAPVQYGYEFMNSAVDDLSGMSPASALITVMQGNHAIIQGQGSADPQADTVVIFRTAQGGSTFFQIATVPNPGAGQIWTWTDDTTDDDLNTEWQAQVSGEGTPLPAGATCLGYHLDRIFAAVGNVVWISSGPDAVAGGSSGNAGFDTFFTAQSKITHFWTCPLGMIVFTVRDAYIILGSATPSDPLYMVVFIEDIPLRSYDCFTVNKTTPYLLIGNQTLLALDPSAGITEVGFPIADRLIEEFDAAASYVTFHARNSMDTALYVANGVDHWYRMAAINAPDTGSAWSPRANFDSLGCVQSVEVAPGEYRLLMSPTSPGPILQRDLTKNTDNGIPYAATTEFGSIVLAEPGQLAELSFITLESVRAGTRPALSLLLGEVSGEFETLKRTRQDPPNLPPSNSLFSDRYHFEQSQKTAWCRHFQMQISWAEEDAQNELLTFTIFGQTWQELRAQ
jgi:hypothetical protein